MNEKQQQLLFDKGITNVPSDALCSDNALEENIGLFHSNGEHRVIQKPKEYMVLDNGYKLLYVHEYGGFTRYIIYNTNNSKLYWQLAGSDTKTEIGTFSAIVVVESVGNTLIVTDGDKLSYLLWDTRSDSPTYKSLGSSIPDIEMEFKMAYVGNNAVQYPDPHHDLTELLDGKIVKETGFDGGVPTTPAVSGSFFKSVHYEDAKAGLIGLVSKRIRQVHEAKRFMFPFWVRYATRLYDGTYTHVSNPILMLPTVRYNWDIFTCDDNGIPLKMDGDHGGWPQTNYLPVSGELQYEFKSYPNLEVWEDIISGVDIFVSEEIKTFDMEGTWTIQNSFIMSNNVSTKNPLFVQNTPLSDSCNRQYNYYKQIQEPSDNNLDNCYTYFQPAMLSDSEIINKLLDASVFYKLIEIDANDINSYLVDTSNVIQRGVLENLTTQDQLNDDYFSRSPMKAAIMKAYNSRLHLADIRRGFFNGFTHFSFTGYNEGAVNYEYYVYINTDNGVRVVKAAKQSTFEIADIWFYYPDPRAFRVQVFDTTDNKLLADLPLKEHERLNGAYSFRRLPTDPNETRPTTTAPDRPTIVTDDEIIKDRLFVSEVDNPYVFTAKGDIAIRLGNIIGLASQTMALGEMEHGIHPMSVFSEKGISLLRLASDGTYTRSDEISREVCNNPKSITETDGPVFFSSEKGLMVMSGTKVTCVSPQLSGKHIVSAALSEYTNPELSFHDFLKGARIGYDYRDSLLWIGRDDSDVLWIYSILTGTFSHYVITSESRSRRAQSADDIGLNFVLKYPDTLIQVGNTVYSLLERKDINDEEALEESYDGCIITRPMKLENGLALKSIMQIRHILQMEGKMTLQIFASNNLNSWVELHSLRGTPWKYYKFRYNFTNMKATDRFAGTVLITQERRMNKLR